MSDEWNWIVLNLNPEPWKVGPVTLGRRGGKMYGNIGRDQQLAAYKEAIKEELEDNSLWFNSKVELQFWFWRNRAAYKTPQARTARKNEVDGTNMQKATEDALQGVLFENDKNVTRCTFTIVEQGENTHGKIVIGIRNAPPSSVLLNQLPWEIKIQVEELDNPVLHDAEETEDYF